MFIARVPSLLKLFVFTSVTLFSSVALAQAGGPAAGRSGNSAQANLNVTITVVPSISVAFDSSRHAILTLANASEPADSLLGLQLTSRRSPSYAGSIAYNVPSAPVQTTRTDETLPFYGLKQGRRVQAGVLKTVTVVLK